MNDHYYSQKPNVQSERKTWDYELKGKNFTFQSDKGVFSKNEVDFGSKLLIETFELPDDVEGDLLDVGCGYGPIGLSIACYYHQQHVDMVDVNERAVELAIDNAVNNKIDNVTIFQSNLYEKVSNAKMYSVILTNPPIRAGKNIVHAIFEEGFQRLKHNGEMWIVIQKKQGAPSAIDKLQEFFSSVEVIAKKKGYFIIKAKKY